MRFRWSAAALLCLFVLGGCELIFNPQDEGTEDAPAALSVNVTHRGSVSAWGTSYYTFVVPAGGTHTISLTDADFGSNLSWHLHDSIRMLMFDCNEWDMNSDETHTFSPLPAGTYYLRVEEWDWQGTWFDLRVSSP
jgi:hypothetical protein